MAANGPRQPAQIGASSSVAITTYVIIWEFRVKQDRRAAFEEAYGPAGIWGKFFKRGEGYVGTELLRRSDELGLYFTIDRWVSQAAFEGFRAKWREEYDAIDRRCEELTEFERRVGAFDTVGPTQLPEGGDL